jgi:alpha/beta superfamily hydrolase
VKREERMVNVPWRDAPEASLEAIFVAGEPGDGRGALVAPPHPLYGGSLDSPVVSEVAYACGRAGLASLRFNWRGVGASAGAASGDPRDADADADAALAHLAETVPGPLLAAGYSFGAAAVLRAARRWTRVERLVLVAPPPSLLGDDPFAGLERRVLVVAGTRDGVAPPAAIEPLLRSAPRAQLAAVADADHFFGTGLAALGRAVFGWLRGHDGDVDRGTGAAA